MPFTELKYMPERGYEPLTFDSPLVYFVVGVRGAAKSSLLETIGEYYLDAENCVLDLFSARDAENLAWLRSPWAEHKKILLLHGENCDVVAPFKTMKAKNLTLHDFNIYDLIISSPLLYAVPNDEFESVNNIINLLYRRPPSWKKIIYCLVREAANLFYSRLKISPSQLTAKSEVAYLTREMRHQGISIGLDSQIITGVDYQVRTQSDFTFVKRMGVIGISKDDPLFFLYKYFDPSFIRRMPKGEFILVGKGGALALGTFEPLPWHKKPRENILAKTGVTVEYGETTEPALGSTENVIGDEEHVRIITLTVKDGLSMEKIGEKLKRSKSTVHKHVHEHDEAIVRSGFCPRCQRAKSIYFIQKAMKGTIK